MKNNNYKYGLIALVVLLVACTFSCKKFVQIPPSSSSLVSTSVFADSTDATGALLGIYTNFNSSGQTITLFGTGMVTVGTGLSGDELNYTGTISYYRQFYQDALSPTSTTVNNQLFEFPYSGNRQGVIYPANALIEGVTASKTLTATVKNQLIGEAEVLRAFTYFNLVNLYGPVPLVTTTNYVTNATLPRSPVASIYQQITNDLLDAQKRLPLSYPSDGRVRVNRAAASALLARVYLYLGDWAGAYTQSNNLISSGTYNLETDLNNVFLAGSNEAIWQALPVMPGYETAEGFNFIPKSSTVLPTFTISSYLLNAFEPGDQRMIDWLGSNTVNGIQYYYPFKYKLGHDNSTTPVEDYMVFRLGEQYLIRAEAEAQGASGSPGLGGAVADLNVIRNRAGLPAYAGATDQASVLAAIYHERQVELFCEWGHRWFDLKRTNRINSVMPAVCTAKGGTWSPNWALYPIPQNDLFANSFLTQNPGY